MKENLRGFTLRELEDIIKSAGFPVYRALQVFQFLHAHMTAEIASMKIVSQEVREFLESGFEITMLKEIAVAYSVLDKTRKFLFEAAEGGKNVQIETVLICEDERRTVCVSTQAGCKVGCEFCATGKMKFGRNLTAGEIVSQVYEVSRLTKERITNVVLMGMGEPLMNYDNVLKALLILTDTKGYALPSRKITVSTVGFKNKIKKLADDITSPGNYALRKLKLALSLHTTDKGLREKLIPTAKLNPLSAIYEELIYFYKITGTKLTYEYIHFEGINDTPDEVKRLTKLSRMIPCNVNIIPFHTVSFELAEPLNKFNKKIHANIFDGNKNSLSKNKINDLITELRGNKVVVNLRSSSGADINAACGQLAVIKS
ncbi:MAG: 23S rRNA (adenine(2503)-C(2))-methyltransferase RlmN [Ignavibacteriae bacterium]|nr:23S rRNA (adenine(2503)-C(2))-methyltransferase RlmN [Ignavibacteriota bacterium]